MAMATLINRGVWEAGQGGAGHMLLKGTDLVMPMALGIYADLHKKNHIRHELWWS